MTKQVKKDNRAQEQAQLQLNSIQDMLKRLELARATDNDDDIELVTGEIENDALAINVTKYYEILLCTGGPAVRITGILDEHEVPSSVRLEYQDWFTRWIEYPLNDKQETALLEYANHYYFEGVTND